MVDKERHTASEVGDEPLLLARRAPVIVNPDRVAGAQKALRSGAEVIVMDDGFQNPGLYKDLSFLVFDGGFGIGNGLSVPAGPLRENFAAGLKRAHAAIILGEDKHNLSAKIAGIPISGAQSFRFGRKCPIPTPSPLPASAVRKILCLHARTRLQPG